MAWPRQRGRRAHGGAAPHLVPARARHRLRRRGRQRRGERHRDQTLRPAPAQSEPDPPPLRGERAAGAAPRGLVRRRGRVRHRVDGALRARRRSGVVTDRPVVVIGAGRGGLACPRTFAREGHRVVLVDRSGDAAIRDRVAGLPPAVEVRLGGYPDDVAVGALMVCPSPGVPWNAPELQVARAHGVPVRSEMDLVFERCRARICGITGTNGKTTTTALVAAILERAGERVHLGGNIGVTMLDALDDVVDTDWVVLELSSFQIESVLEPRCAIACVLNVTADHLDRHGDFETYAE